MSKYEEIILRRGLDSIINIFPDHEIALMPDGERLIIKREKLQSGVHIVNVLGPALVHAHQFFGENLPKELVSKLKNKTQTEDTIFELNILGYLQACHSVEYEPKLASGKVPDLKVCLAGQPPLFVECKSLHFHDSKYESIFRETVQDIMPLARNWPAKRSARYQGLRIEIRPEEKPNSKDLIALAKCLENANLKKLVEGIDLEKRITIVAVPTNMPLWDKRSFRASLYSIRNQGRILESQNSDLIIYSWRGIENSKRRSFKAIISSARQQLRNIPIDSFGMICLQIRSNIFYESDIGGTLARNEFARIPLIWICGLNNNKVFCRNDASQIRDAIFNPIRERITKAGG